jgi:hypothetical protein
LVWGRPYRLVEVKARAKLDLGGNLKAMIEYVGEYGGHIELWIRSAKHADGATRLSKPLLDRLKALETEGRAAIKIYP